MEGEIQRWDSGESRSVCTCGPWSVQLVQMARHIRDLSKKNKIKIKIRLEIVHEGYHLSRFGTPFQTQLETNTRLPSYYTVHDPTPMCGSLKVRIRCPNMEVCVDHIDRLSTEIGRGLKPTKNAMVIDFCINYIKISTKNILGDSTWASVIISTYPTFAPTSALQQWTLLLKQHNTTAKWWALRNISDCWVCLVPSWFNRALCCHKLVNLCHTPWQCEENDQS